MPSGDTAPRVNQFVDGSDFNDAPLPWAAGQAASAALSVFDEHALGDAGGSSDIRGEVFGDCKPEHPLRNAGARRGCETSAGGLFNRRRDCYITRRGSFPRFPFSPV
jgi:hypothetical protein